MEPPLKIWGIHGNPPCSTLDPWQLQDAIAFVAKLLQRSPVKRYTAKEASHLTLVVRRFRRHVAENEFWGFGFGSK